VGRGSTLTDEQYRDLQGVPGFFQLEHKVYGRAGQPCLSCGREIERLRFGAKSAYLCRSCQR
jgi:formamidopyrimidine-DNA glycosylase